MSLAPETHHGFNLDNTKINGTSFECALCTFTPVVKIQTSTLHCSPDHFITSDRAEIHLSMCNSNNDWVKLIIISVT